MSEQSQSGGPLTAEQSELQELMFSGPDGAHHEFVAAYDHFRGALFAFTEAVASGADEGFEDDATAVMGSYIIMTGQCFVDIVHSAAPDLTKVDFAAYLLRSAAQDTAAFLEAHGHPAEPEYTNPEWLEAALKRESKGKLTAENEKNLIEEVTQIYLNAASVMVGKQIVFTDQSEEL